MKTNRVVSSLCCAILPLLGALSVSSEAQADKLRVHAVTAGDGWYLDDAEPGSPPSAEHPEGTVFGIVRGPRPLPQQTTVGSYVAEIDVEKGRTLHRLDLACDVILREKGRLYAACGPELLAFDAATFGIVWRVPVARCPDGYDRGGATARAAGGADRVVGASDCSYEGGLYLRVLSSVDGAVLGGTSTRAHTEARWMKDLTRISFHGATVVLVAVQHASPSAIVVLAPGYDRVAHRLAIGEGQEAWDDGVHVHVTERRPPGTPAELKSFGRDHASRGGPSWLVQDRDYTLSDSLAPLSWARLTAPVESTGYSPDGSRGDYTAYGFDQGPQRFWVERYCCGDHAPDSSPAGVFVGTIPR